MIFNTLHFLVFFMVVTLWFFRLQSQKARAVLLLVASCYFYMARIPQYILVLGGIIVVDYVAGIQIEKSEGRRRKLWFFLSLLVNIGTLATFKYYNFFIDNVHSAFSLLGNDLSLPALKWALPIGLSFHTFQAMSYTIEVYRNNQKAEKNFLNYALYVMFYPQLVAGPIERPQNILHQLREYRDYNSDNVKAGLARMAWGFFKKVVVADRLAMAVDRTYLHTSESSSLAILIGAFFYSFQIYCDFSGYCDIAIGAAKIMNINLMENFDQPYWSKNVTTFWRKWHISLSGWFYDYLFNPLVLALRNRGKMAILVGLLVTFFISGFWHGAGWRFVVFGLLHGLALVVEYFTRKSRQRLFKNLPERMATAIGISATFCFTMLAWVFFRAENMRKAFEYLRALFAFRGGSHYVGMNRIELAFSFALIGITLWREKYKPAYLISSDNKFYAYIFFMSAICYYFGVFVENQFIYFQF